jgi:hypothetical protein
VLKFLGIFSGILGFVCVFPYIRDIFRKTTRPERASWFIWLVLGLIAFFSQLSKGASNSLWLTGAGLLSVSTVFLLSLKYGEGGLVKRDIIALFVAFVGLVIWYFTKDATIALILVVLINSVGSVLTVTKAYKDPGSEL